MSTVITTIVSILAIAAAAWAAGRALRLALCPICTGVAGTWLWMVLARYFGVAIDVAMLSTLLGGSVVGIAYQLEKRLAQGCSPLLWKMLFIPVGFAAAWGLAVAHWVLLAVALVVLVVLTAFFLWPRANANIASTTVQELEDKMKNCC